jgi:hypothetical protein
LAYARADEIGIVSLEAEESPDDRVTPLLDFVPLKTFGEWVWVPGLSWSPDGNFIAATVHGPPLASEPEDESQLFDLWLISVDGELKVKVAEQVGMWANPAWSESGIAFGQAVNPLQSVNSRYSIQLMDRDGSNKRQLFPFQTEPGVQFPEFAWAPGRHDLLFTYNGKLYLTTSSGTPPRQLTTDGQASLPQWVAEAPVITRATSITRETTITGSVSITASQLITDRSTISPTPATSATPTFPKPGATLTATPSITNAMAATPTISEARTITPAATRPSTGPRSDLGN